MREISKEKLDEILGKHQSWLNNEDGGERADLRYANLSYADLRYANLRYADLSYADLSYANLSSADLRYADLSYTDLRYANLRYATGQFYITQRSDGYQFFLVQDEEGAWFVRAGCQYRSIESYREHTKNYRDEAKRVETNLILDFAEAKLKALFAESEEQAA